MAAGERLGDVAARTFADARVLPLFTALNPGMADRAAPCRGAVVTVPSRAEVVRFARAHGFTLGQKAVVTPQPGGLRAWVQLRDGAPPPAPAKGPETLCASLVGEGLSPGECVLRLESAFGAEALEDFSRAAHRAPEVQEVAVALRHAAATRRCAAALGALRELLLGTCTPAGRRHLVNVVGSWPEASRAVMSALLVDDAIQRCILREASILGPRLGEAMRIGRQEVWERSLERRLGAGDGDALESWGARVAIGLEPLEDGALGQEGGGFGRLEAHLRRVATTLAPLTSRLEVAPVELLEAAATGNATGEMAAPWPVFAALVQRTRSWLELLNVEQRADGIARLVEAVAAPQDSTRRGPYGAGLTPAALVVRQAVGERAARRHDEIPARLATTWLQVVSGVLPAAAMSFGGRATRRQRLERALLMPRSDEASTVAVEQALNALLEALPRELLLTGKHDTKRLRSLALSLAAVWTSPLPVGERRATPLARAALLVAAVLDGDLGASCASREGHAFVAAALQRYGAATVSRGMKIGNAAGEDSSTAMPPALLAPIRPARTPGWLPS